MSVKVLVIIDVQEPALPDGLNTAYAIYNPKTQGTPQLNSGYKRHFVEIDLPCTVIPVTKVVVKP